ncbi:hypothetical protein GCM10009815_08720 [Nocardioides marmoribigeumensis]
MFAARQLARELAQVVGLDRIGATRLATAISELAREAAAAGGRLSFEVQGSGDLVATLTASHLPDDSPSMVSARRLLDTVTHEVADGLAVVRLEQRGVRPVTDAERHRVQRIVAAHAPTSPLDELQQQNAELLTLLDAVREKNAALETLNHELEETNRGVMALYSELSGELERTNQGVVALYAEIDEKNLQLTAASEAKSRFLRSISHELRTPVNSVLGLTGLLADPGAAPLSPEQGEQVAFIRASATELLSLVNELMDLAKAESGRLEPAWQDVDLAALCGELAGTTRALLREGVRLEVDPGPPGLVLRTDPDLVRHVLRNLLSNAAKFTTAGTVTLEVTQVDGVHGVDGVDGVDGADGADAAEGVEVRVRDTGIGMTEEEQALVFEEFFQVRTPLHATARGTGLGLPFARSVAQVLGGDIDVESAPGEGSSFTLRLPAGGAA